MPLNPEGQRDRQRRLRASGKQEVRQPGRTDVLLGGMGLVPVVLRSIDIEAGEMHAQRLRYKDSPPVVGSYETYGEQFQVYPLTTAVYADYEHWLWPDDPITTATVPLLALNDRGYWMVMIPFKAHGALLPPDEPVNECGFG